jgi:hypothetical protein
MLRLTVSLAEGVPADLNEALTHIDYHYAQLLPTRSFTPQGGAHPPLATGQIAHTTEPEQPPGPPSSEVTWQFREYGTPGIARAQQLAARALRDTSRQHLAEAAFTNCVTDPEQIGYLIDRSLCHGTAGLLATSRRIAADAVMPTPVTPLADLHRQAVPAEHEPAGLLNGTAGVDLATAGTTTTSWDACLLLT